MELKEKEEVEEKGEEVEDDKEEQGCEVKMMKLMMMEVDV